MHMLMDIKIAKGISKLLSYILRHSPETIKLKLDENGWAEFHCNAGSVSVWVLKVG